MLKKGEKLYMCKDYDICDNELSAIVMPIAKKETLLNTIIQSLKDGDEHENTYIYYELEIKKVVKVKLKSEIKTIK